MTRPEVKTLADIRDTAKAFTEWCLAQPDLTGWSIRLMLPPDPILVVRLEWDDIRISHAFVSNGGMTLSPSPEEINYELEEVAKRARRLIDLAKGPQR